MSMYSSEPYRSVPDDERSEGNWRIIRNGTLYARRPSLGAARAVVRNVMRIAGSGDQWAIVDADGNGAELEA